MKQSELLDHLKDIQSEIEDSDNSCEVEVANEGLGNECSIVLYSLYSLPESEVPNFINPSSIQTCIKGIEYLFELDSDIKFTFATFNHVNSHDSWERFKYRLNYRRYISMMKIVLDLYPMDLDGLKTLERFNEFKNTGLKLKKFN